MKWSLEKKVTAGFGLGFLILLIIVIVSYRNTSRLIETGNLVAHTHEVLTEIKSILSSIEAAESGQHSFIITGEESYLETYHDTISRAYQHLGNIKRLTADNHNQQNRLSYLEPKIEERLELLQQGIKLRKEKGYDAAQKVIATGKGKSRMDEIRKIFSEMEDEERDLLVKRSNELETIAGNTTFTFFLGGILQLALFSIVYYRINRDNTRRKNAEQESRRQADEAQKARVQLSAVLANMREGLYQL